MLDFVIQEMITKIACDIHQLTGFTFLLHFISDFHDCNRNLFRIHFSGSDISYRSAISTQSNGSSLKTAIKTLNLIIVADDLCKQKSTETVNVDNTEGYVSCLLLNSSSKVFIRQQIFHVVIQELK